MKKWIILAVLAILLVAGILLAENLNQPVDSGITLKPEPSTTEETYSAEDLALMVKTFEEYEAMTAEEQEEFKNSFSSLQVYIDWYWMAKEEYDDKQDVVIIGPGQDINIGDFIGGGE